MYDNDDKKKIEPPRPASAGELWERVKPPWQVWQSFIILVAAMLLSTLPVLFSTTAAHLSGVVLLSLFLQAAVFFMGPLLIVCVYYSQPLTALGFRRAPAVKMLGIGVAAGSLFYALNVLVSLAQTLLFPAAEPVRQDVLTLLELSESGFETLMLVLCIAVLAPVSEEMFFRAFLLPPLRARYGRSSALLLSAMLFALMHMNGWVLMPMFAGGLGFAWLYDKYANIGYNIIAHMTWNGISLLLFFIYV
ncbi:MAG: type II CAAX endopeptidase family protein [Bacillota bacterium]|nr:type II CAAX endopeptidase family protein [Bacillota bacterium]